MYLLQDSLTVAVYSEEEIGLIAVFGDNKNPDLLDELIQLNPTAKLHGEFSFPGGRKITYDVHAPKNKWVINSVNDQPTDRNFDAWPLIEVLSIRDGNR